jgi:hypothetical protein
MHGKRGSKRIHSGEEKQCNYDLHFMCISTQANELGARGCLMISDGMFIKLFNMNTIFTHGKFSIRNRKYIELTRHTEE